MKDYLFKFTFIMIIIFLSYPSLSKDIVKVKKKSSSSKMFTTKRNQWAIMSKNYGSGRNY